MSCLSCLSDLLSQLSSLCFGPTLSIISANIDNSIQVHIPREKKTQSFITKMKCQVTSSTTHDVLISKEILYKSYKEICSGEKKKVNLGYNNDDGIMKVENNSLVHTPRTVSDHIYGLYDSMSFEWEVLSKFFSLYNIEPNWLNCNSSWGYYDEDLGGWTGCMGKV